MLKRCSIFLLLLMLPGLCQPLQPVTTVEGISEYRLQNGLKVLLFPDPTAPKITVNITYLVGSRHEGYGETGMAHLLEHLLFKGSTNHPNIPEELTAHGARPNGTTWYDRTNYYETFPASSENLKWALDLEADRMVNSFVAKKDLDSEMTVVRNEFESGENNPAGILMQRVFSTAFLWHNYGQATIGARSDIENVMIDRLQAFYRRYYQPDNAILMVAGKFEPDQALELIQQKFGPIPAPDRKLNTTYTSEPTQDGERKVTLRRTGEVQVVATGYHIPSGAHPDFAPTDVLGEVLGDTPSGRLYKSLVDSKLATSVYGGAFQLREPGLMFFLAELRKGGSTDKALEVLVDTVESHRAFTVEEVERAKTSLLKRMEATFRSSERVALQISEWAAMGDWRLFFLHRDRLEKVTPSDVERVAEAYLRRSNRTAGVFLPTEKPTRAEIPALEDVEALVADYKGRQNLSVGEAFDPSPENIETRVERFNLSPGVEVAFLPKKTRGQSVNLTITFRFGDLERLQGQREMAQFSGSMLMRGAADKTREQLKDRLDQLRATGGVAGDYNSVEVAFETTRENLPELLQLVGEILRKPTFPESEFETLRQAYLAELESGLNDPQTLASNFLRRHLSPYPDKDPRHLNTLEENLKLVEGMTLAEVRQFYQNFYGASHGQIAIVGDFDPTAIKPVLEAEFATWKSPSQYQRIESLYHDVAAVNKTISVPDKANAVWLAALNLKLQDSDADYAPLVLGNYILGGGFLNSRLATRIRQKDGLSYGVGSQIRASSLEPSGRFFIYAIAAPENIEKVEAAVLEELQKALDKGFSPEEIELARNGLLESLKVGLGKDSTLAGTLEEYLFLGRTMKWRADYYKKLEAVTAADIEQALRKHLQPEKLSIVKAGSL